jgi:hypothetical protein
VAGHVESVDLARPAPLRPSKLSVVGGSLWILGKSVLSGIELIITCEKVTYEN